MLYNKVIVFKLLTKFYVEKLLFLMCFGVKIIYSIAREEVTNGTGSNLIQWESEGFSKLNLERGLGWQVDFIKI